MTNEDNTSLIKDKDIKIKFKPLHYIIVGIVLILSLVSAFLNKQDILFMVQVGLLSVLLTYISLVDIETHLCPNWPNFIIFALAIPNLILYILAKDYYNLINVLLGGLFGFLPLFLAALFTKKGIGGADIKIMTSLGFLIGPYKIISVLFTSLLLAIIVSVIRGIKNKNIKEISFAFLPYISIATLIIWPLNI